MSTPLVFGSDSAALTGIRCVAATLSSNMDLCLWAPVKNSLKGEWKNVITTLCCRFILGSRLAKLFNITPFLLDHLQSSEMQESDNKTPLVLKAQITSNCLLNCQMHYVFTSCRHGVVAAMRFWV